MNKAHFLPDVNVLIALSDMDHVDHRSASNWLGQIGEGQFLLCPITEAGFVRMCMAPHVGKRAVKEALGILREMTNLSCYAYLPILEPWLQLIQPFASRLHGYRQVTDAYLLGLAIKHDVILVTLDQHIQALAGMEFKRNLLTLK